MTSIPSPEPSGHRDAPPPPLQAVLGRYALALMGSFALWSVADTLLLAARGWLSPGTALHYAATGVAGGAWLGGIAGGGLALAHVALRPLLARVQQRDAASYAILLGALVGFSVAVVALLVLKRHPLPTLRVRLDVLLPAGGAALGVVVGLALPRAPERRGAWFAVSAVLVTLLNVLAFPGHYQVLHDIAFLLGLGLAALALDVVPRRSRRGPRAVLVLALAAQLAGAFPLHDVRLAGGHGGFAVPSVLAWLHFLVDLDKDGFSQVLGGGDCDDFDPERRPGVCEVPGNGVDDNCNGVVDGVWDPPTPPVGQPGRARRDPLPDVYFVLIDALRADLGGLTVEGADLAPWSALRASALTFDAAYTPYPGTFYAMRAMNQAQPYRDTRDDAPTFVGALLEAGYEGRFALADEHRELSLDVPFLMAARGASDPFHVPSHGKLGWSARIVDGAIAELDDDSARAPRFRWLHLLDTHAPRARGEGDERDVYRNEARHALAQVSRLARAFSENPSARGRVLIVASDHGETFGEHGGSFHGSELYDEQTRVVLVMALPGVAPARIVAPASLMDVWPTLVAYLGLPMPRGVQGVDWLSARRAPGQPRVLSAVAPVDNWAGFGRAAAEAVMDGRFKLIYNSTRNTFELYDLLRDPGERVDQLGRLPEEAERLREALRAWQDRGTCQLEY